MGRPGCGPARARGAVARGKRMIFSSPVFILLFLPLVLVVTLVSPRSWRNVELLLASLVFYAWGEGLFVGIMLASIRELKSGRDRGQSLGWDRAVSISIPPFSFCQLYR